MRMEMTISSLFHTIMVISLIMGTITRVNLSQLESKILNGYRVKEVYKYMASLQLDDKHICSSGMFQTGLLLTTLTCAIYIEKGILVERKKGTAVLGSSELATGQRVKIDQIKYTSQGQRYYYHVGVIKLATDVSYTNVESLDLYPERVDLRTLGVNSMMCGWGTVKNDDIAGTFLGNASSSKNLHCMFVSLASVTNCRPSIRMGEFRKKLLCGLAENQQQAPTWGDVGSPLTKMIMCGKEEKEYIIGLTLDRFNDVNRTFLRFIRSSFIFPYIKELTSDVNSGLREGSDRISSNQQDWMDKHYKRRKYE